MAALPANDTPTDDEGKKRRQRAAAICAPVVSDLLKDLKDGKEIPPAALALFQWDCAKNPDHKELCLALGHRIEAPKPAAKTPAELAKDHFGADRYAEKYLTSNAEAAKKFQQAVQACQGKPEAQRGACVETAKRDVTRGAASLRRGEALDQSRYYARPQDQQKRALLKLIIERQPDDGKMGERFDANVGRMTPQQFERNYAGVMQGRPITEEGRAYLRNACKDVQPPAAGADMAAQQLSGICQVFARSDSRRGNTVPSPETGPRTGRAAAARAPVRDDRGDRLPAGVRAADVEVIAANSPFRAALEQRAPGWYREGSQTACNRGESGCKYWRGLAGR